MEEQNKVNIEVVSIDDLIQDDHNFNKGNEQGAQLLERSFRECGAGRSVLIDKDNRLVGGNKAQKGFKAAGKKKVIIVDSDADTLVAVRRKDVSLDSAEGRKMAYLDNLTTQVNLTWDETEIQTVQADVEGFDIADFGFDIEDLPQVTFPTGEKQGEGEGKPQTEVKEDDFDPDAHYETKVKAGEVWQLGEHRLMCGDSTDADAVAKLMNGERADIAFTSPPYNAGSINQADNPRTHAKYGEYDDNKTSAEYLDFIKTNVGILLDNADEVFYNIGLVSGNKKEIFQLINIYLDKFKDMLYWRKSNCAPCIQPGVINNLVEFIIAFGNNGTRRFKNPQFSQGSYYNVIEGKNASDNEYSKIHKATFPVYLPAEFIKSFTPENGSVLDCFGGTGTTMIAAEQLGRKCFMMELDPHYCTVIIARWEKLTGQKAIKLNP